MTISFRTLITTYVGISLLSGVAMAQDTEVGRVFELPYFDQYAPSTAMDMLNRIPGFQLDRGDNKRGLGQGGANVLINGQRLSGKTDNPFEQVSRIPAKNVIKIEIVDGTSLNIPGLSGQVANLTTQSTGMTGTWEWRPEWREGLKPNLFPGFITISGETGSLSYTAKVQNNSFRNGHSGPEDRSFANGTLFERRDERARYNGDNPGASVNLTWKPKADHIGNLNLEYNQFNFHNRTISDLTAITSSGSDGQHIFRRSEDEWNAKIDGDYEFPFADGKLKLIGYYRTEDSPTLSQFQIYDSSGQIESTQFHQQADEGEAIGRTEYSWSPSEGRDWTLGVEGVLNYLDVESKFVDLLTLPSGTNPNTLPYDNITEVEELRGEATITHSRPLSTKWDLQVSIGAEYSEISSRTIDIASSTTDQQTRRFFRPKGFASTTYKPSDTFNIRAKIEREVGQLNFFDFVSSVSLDDNLATAGNINIVPNQSWLGELEFDKQFTGGHSFKARLYGEKISDLVDRIPIGLTGDGVGNIDAAERYGVDFNATLKGDPWGLKGAELNLSLDIGNSRVEDPVEFFDRRLNSDIKHSWSVSFRHDIQNSDWAWGFYSDQQRVSATYRLSTVNQYTFNGPWAHAYIEHKDIFGMKVNASLRNLLDASDDFRREIYTDRRDLGTLDIIEDRSRPFGYFFRLAVSDTF